MSSALIILVDSWLAVLFCGCGGGGVADDDNKVVIGGDAGR